MEEMSLSPSILCTTAAFSLNGEYTSYVLSFRMVFFYMGLDLLGFLTSAYVRIYSINQSEATRFFIARNSSPMYEVLFCFFCQSWTKQGDFY